MRNPAQTRLQPSSNLHVSLQEWQVCQATVGVLGDVCRAIEDQIAPYTEPIMTILLHNLESPDVQRSIKPQILSAFGDIALAIGDRFEAMLTPCLHMLSSAQVSLPCLSWIQRFSTILEEALYSTVLAFVVHVCFARVW
jgi:hypothetical protein